MRKKMICLLIAALFQLTWGGVAVLGASSGDGVADRAPGKKKSENKISDEYSGLSMPGVLKNLKFSGGISAGDFYLTNAPQDSSSNDVLLSNFLIEIATKNEKLPVQFSGAFGETSTPTLLDAPENNRNFDIEYASLLVRPVTHISLEVGLLQPCSGYEDTYTYNNPNIVLGVVASQQPYNAYGGRMTYTLRSVDLCLAYYTSRLDREEYSVPGRQTGDAWEAAVSGEISGLSYNLYHYHLENLKNLTGFALEHQSKNLLLAFDFDVWNWSDSLDDYYKRSYALGGALYVVPSFGKVSLPIRLEIINQGGSKIYIDSEEANDIYSITVTPTYHFTDNSFIRSEASYVYAEKGFVIDSNRVKNGRIYLAAEVGYLF